MTEGAGNYDIDDYQSLLRKEQFCIFKRLKKFLLDRIIEIFEPEFNTQISYKQQIIREMITTIIITIQMISLLWYPGISLRHWSSYSVFWDFLRFFNYDDLCAKLNFYSFCTILNITMISSSLLIASSHLILKNFNFSLPYFLIYTAKTIISYFTSILLIPFLTNILVVFKYSTYELKYVQEYDSYKTSDYNFGILGTILSLLVLVIFIPTAFMIEIVKGDLRHSVAHKNLKARSNSLWDILCIFFFMAQCFLFVFVDKSHYEYHLVVSTAMAIYLLVLEFKFLHYLNPAENSIQACKMGCISVCSAIFLFAYSINEAGALILLCIFLPPLSCFFITTHIYKKYSKLEYNRICLKNQYTLEHSIRHLLTDKNCENKNEINELLSRHFNSKMKKNALYVIWEVNFCIYILKNERLGRVILTKYGFLKENFDAYIQRLRILKKFEESTSGLPEIEYLDSLLNLDKVKKSDAESCLLLLDLWAEIARNAPNINKVRIFVTKIYKLIYKIKKLYDSLSQEIRNSEVFDLCGSFLIDILGEFEEGNNILKRKLNIKNPESLIDLQKFQNYDERIGIILISTDFSAFGTVAYMNKTAAIILKVSSTEIIGHDFNLFIPKPFSLNHNDCMLNYYKSCTNTELENSHASFLQNYNEYIFECNTSIKLTAFKNKAYFMISFTQSKTSRQILSISKEGQIYSHSSQLASIIGLERKNYSGMNISDIIPGVNLFNLPSFEPVIIYHNFQKLVLIHTIRKAKSEAIHMILVIKDWSEIEEWKSQVSYETGERFSDFYKTIKELPNVDNENELIVDTKIKKLTFHLSPTEKTSYITTTHDIRNSEMIDEEIPLPQASASSASSFSISVDRKFYSGYSSKCISNISKAIKKFQWILFFSIIAMIGTNIGILVYVIEEVTHTNSLEVFNHLGQIMFYIGSTANIVRSINIEIEQGIYNLTRDSMYYSQNIAYLSILQETLLSEKSQWKYCPSSTIVMENIIPLWEFDMGKPYLRKYNLYDTVTNFIMHGQMLLKYAKTKEIGYVYESEWLMINSVGYTFNLISDSLSGLVECEINRIYDSSLSITLLLWTGLIIIGLCLAILIYFIIKVRIAYENFWKFIKKSVMSNYVPLMLVVYDRLTSVHGIDRNKRKHYNLNNPPKTQNYYIKTNITWKFFWRLLFLLLISIAFYLLVILYLYKTCETYMINRPKLLQNFNTRRTLLARIGYFTRDINRPVNQGLYTESYSLADPSTELEKSIFRYWDKYKSLRSEFIYNLLSTSIRKRIFEEIDSPPNFMKYGTGAATYSVIFDAFYMGVHESRSLTEKDNFITNFTALQESMYKSFAMTDSSSKEIIFSQLNTIIIITFAFSIGLALLYIFYYLPFIKAESRYLKKASILPKMISEIGNQNY